VRQGIRLSPRDPFLVYWLLYIGVAQLHQGQDAAALETFFRLVPLAVVQIILRPVQHSPRDLPSA